MSALYATSTVSGTLYVDGTPAATLGERPVKAEIGEEGAHLLFAPHEDGYLPVAREIRLLGGAAPEGVGGLEAVLWPGGSLEIAFRPMRYEPPEVVDTAPFMGGTAQLKRGDRVLLEVEGESLLVGEGPGCGLRALPGGFLAAFAQQGVGESLLVVAPGVAGPESVLCVQGEQVLLSADGERVRVHEFVPPGALHRAVREYRRERAGFLAQPAAITPSARIASSGQEIARALAAAIQMGAYEEALAMLTPSLRSVVDAQTLASFFGEFDGYTEARHAIPPRGLELLALLRPEGNAHIARLMAFEVVRTELGLRVENVKAWE